MGQVGAPTPAHVDVQMGNRIGWPGCLRSFIGQRTERQIARGSSASQVIGCGQPADSTGPTTVGSRTGVLILGSWWAHLRVKRWADNTSPNMPTIRQSVRAGSRGPGPAPLICSYRPYFRRLRAIRPMTPSPRNATDTGSGAGYEAAQSEVIGRRIRKIDRNLVDIAGNPTPEKFENATS